MKTILCPTDFSAASENAIRYAFELNRKFNAKIILFYSYHLPIPASDIQVNIPDPVELRKEAMSRLLELRAKLKKDFSSVAYEIDIMATEGDPVSEIKGIIENQQINLVISGTKGASGLRRVLVGSNSASIIVKSGCPVITVPVGSTYHPFRKIVFATNYAEGDFDHIEKVIALAKPFDAQVIMLHISEGKLDKTAEFAAIERFKQRIAEDSGYDNLIFKLFESRNIEEGILLYLDEIKADLIAMTNRHRTFFQKLFDRSLTKQVAFDSNTPLLAFHEAEQEAYL